MCYDLSTLCAPLSNVYGRLKAPNDRSFSHEDGQVPCGTKNPTAGPMTSGGDFSLWTKHGLGAGAGREASRWSGVTAEALFASGWPNAGRDHESREYLTTPTGDLGLLRNPHLVDIRLAEFVAIGCGNLEESGSIREW